jgi:putative phosphoribosyl transferase
MEMRSQMEKAEVRIPAGAVILSGELKIPDGAKTLVLFAHGSGSSRHSPRNQFVAGSLRQTGLGTLLFDLLTPPEEAEDAHTGELRFDLDLLAERLVAATRWVRSQPDARDLRVGYFGSSTGGGAALMAAAELSNEVVAVVSRGGRPDLAGSVLPRVKCPTLLIVGALDQPVIELNQQAFERLQCRKELTIVPGASHLFEEPGALDQVARLAADWFRSV